MKIKVTEYLNTREIALFLNKHLVQENDGVSSPEFFYPLGLKVAGSFFRK